MKPFQFEIKISAVNEKDAEAKLKAAIVLFNNLSTEELKKMAEVVSNPVKLAIVKSKLL